MRRYNKLIRDNVPQIKSRRGRRIIFHTADSDEEYWRKLLDLLQEQIDSFAHELDHETLAEVFEIMDAIMEFKRIDRVEVRAIKENKKIEKGGFTKRFVLDADEDAPSTNYQEP